MNIGKLIERLKQYDPEMEICVWNCYENFENIHTFTSTYYNDKENENEIIFLKGENNDKQC